MPRTTEADVRAVWSAKPWRLEDLADHFGVRVPTVRDWKQHWFAGDQFLKVRDGRYAYRYQLVPTAATPGGAWDWAIAGFVALVTVQQDRIDQLEAQVVALQDERRALEEWIVAARATQMGGVVPSWR